MLSRKMTREGSSRRHSSMRRSWRSSLIALGVDRATVKAHVAKKFKKKVAGKLAGQAPKKKMTKKTAVMIIDTRHGCED